MELRAQLARLSVDGATERCATAPRVTGLRPIAGVGHWFLALMDQAFVCGTRFLAVIIVARTCGPAELGRYSIAFSLLVLACCLQEAIITTPYAILAQRLRPRSRATYAGAVVRLHVCAVAGSAAICGAVALAGFLFDARTLATIALALAITVPCSLVAEFVRRFSLAQLEVRRATSVDAAVATIQLIALLVLAQLDWLGARTALLAVGVAYATPAVYWWTVAGRRQFHLPAAVAPYWRRNWSLGRWLAASQLMGTIHGLMPVWLLALLVGSYATGEFVACLNFVLLANLLFFAVGNLLAPRAAQALIRGGPRAVQHLVYRVLLYLAATVALFAIGLTAGGNSLISWIYGDSFTGAGNILGVLGLTTIAWAVGATFVSGLAALRQQRWSVVANCAGALVTAFSIITLVPNLSAYGASWGFFLGSAVAAVIHAWAFVRCSGGMPAPRLARIQPDFDPRLVLQDPING